MLEKSSRPVTAKQGLMADPFWLPSPTGNYTKPLASSPLFSLSPRVFVGLSPKGYSDIDATAMSPTSILETKPFTSTASPFFSEKNPRKPVAEQTHESKQRRQPVGLGIVDTLKKPAKPESRMVLFGSQLKIQIPSLSPDGLVKSLNSPIEFGVKNGKDGLVESLNSPIEFGVKNKESQLAMLSPAVWRTPMEAMSLVSGSLSVSEMEMSEDYTCVIAHGPNPKTTHIFDNCIVESCGGDGFAAVTPRKESRVSDDFLAACHACKKRLGQGEDIFMYRGEKAFCSSECRYQEMLFDEGMEDCSPTPDPSATI